MTKKNAVQSDMDRVESYLAKLTPNKRAALQKLRLQIREAAPDAVERISYGMPAFDLDGPLVGYAAAKDHCSFFPMNGTTVAEFANELAAFDTAKGTIRFDPTKPLPAAFIKKIVKARAAENKAKASAKSEKKKPAVSAPASKKAPGRKATGKEPDVDAFFAALSHPLKKEIAEIRAIVLAADTKISEGVKWNSVSFKTADYFATIHLRSTNAVQLVLHRGAKSRDGGKEMAVPDPKGLMKWLSSDRCLVTLGKGRDIAANRKAFEAIVRAWVTQL